MKLEEKRYDFEDNFMVIQLQDDYLLITPTSSELWPKKKFWRLVGAFADKLLEDNYVWTDMSGTRFVGSEYPDYCTWIEDGTTLEEEDGEREI